MDDAKRLAILLEDCEPRRAVGGVGRLVHASRFLRADDRADLGAKTRRNRSILDDPGDMGNGGDGDVGEVLAAECAAFGVVPGEGSVLHHHEVVEKTSLFFP